MMRPPDNALAPPDPDSLVDDDDENDERDSPYNIPCIECGAGVGEPCKHDCETNE